MNFSFWFCRPLGSHFGGVLGAQMEAKAIKKTLQKKRQKYDAQNEPKLVPKGVPKWSQNHKKWVLGSTLLQGWLPSGLQTPPRIDFGEVLGPFWDHFQQFVEPIVPEFCMRSWTACCKHRPSKSQGFKQKVQQRACKKKLLSSCRLALKSSLANVNELSSPC